MYKAMDIAQYIITKCTRDGSPVSNLQLQKILYWVQGEYLAISGRPLFQEDFFSWQIGPVMPNVYYRFCGYGASKILGRYPGIMIEKDTKALIDQIVEEKRALYPSAVACAVWPSCHKNSLERKNGRVSFSQRTTLHH